MNNTQLPDSTAVLKTYCKNCDNPYEVPKDRIFSGGKESNYATRCPNCGFGRPLPFKEVEAIYGKLKV